MPKEGHPDHCSLCRKRHDEAVESYMAALLRCSEGRLDAAWSKLSPEAQAEVTRRLEAAPRVSVTDYHWSVETPPKPTQEQRELRELPTFQIVGRHKDVH